LDGETGVAQPLRNHAASMHQAQCPKTDWQRSPSDARTAPYEDHILVSHSPVYQTPCSPSFPKVPDTLVARDTDNEGSRCLEAPKRRYALFTCHSTQLASWAVKDALYQRDRHANCSFECLRRGTACLHSLTDTLCDDQRVLILVLRFIFP
jgi:hypothetical protein